MQIQVNVNNLKLIQSDELNENEYNIHNIQFNFSNEYAEELVKVALFTANDTTYKVIITNNQCNIPAEVLANQGCFVLGVYAFEVQEDELIERYSPSPIKLYIENGSYIPDEDTENSEPLTPTDKEQILSQLAEIELKLGQVDVNTQDIANIKNEQITQNENISTNSNDISVMQTKLNTIETGAEVNIIEDVKVNGTSLPIVNKSVNVEVPTKTSQLTNDSNFVNETQMNNAIAEEATIRQNADNNLQSQIDAITVSSDVIDVLGTYQDLQNYDTSLVKANDIIKVLQDSTHNGAISYYRWVITDHVGAWVYVGSEGPYYTKSETDNLLQEKANQTDLDTINQNVTNLQGRMTTAEGKIADIEEKQTTQNSRITALENEVDTLQQEVEDLENNQLISPPVSGTSIDISDSASAKNKSIGLIGNTIQSNLPYGFTQLDYIESTGSQYIDTGITADNTVEFDVTFNTSDNLGNSTYGCIFGSRQASVTKELQVTTYSDSGFYGTFRYGDSGNYNAYLTRLQKINVKLLNGKYIVDNEEKYSVDKTFSNNYNIYIFALNNGGTAAQYGKVKLYTLKLYKAGSLVRNFIPCKSVNNEIGLFDLISNTFFANKGTGSFIAGDVTALTPTPENPIELKSTGDNVNLFDVETISRNKSLSNGVEVSTSGWYASDFIEVNANEKYFIYGPNKTAGRDNFFYDENKNYLSSISAITGELTIPSNAKYLRFNGRIFELTEVKLEKGTKATPYSPYNCGNVNEKFQNKNFLPTDNINKTQAGLTITSQESGSLLFNGTKYGNGNFDFNNNIIELEPGDYTLAMRKKSGTVSSTTIPIYILRASDNEQLTTRYVYTPDGIKGNWTTAGLKNFTVTEKNNYYLRFIIADNVVFTDLDLEIIIYKGTLNSDTIGDFIKHEEQNISFLLAPGQKFMQGDYLADDGVHHVTEEKVLTGEETIGILQKCYYINFPNKKSRTTLTRRKLLSNVFKEDLGAYGASDTGLYKMFEGYNPSGNKNIFFNYDNAEGGVNVFKAYLAEQYANGTPVKVKYELAQEVIDPYTEEQQTAWEQIKALRTYKPVTHISSEDETPATVNITYVRDLETVINELSSAIVAQGGV